ncbi:MAG: hypothetical protein NTW58_05040 [Actinobacteria bacterium]|nr:hypothetical protein [Actinomycetota bacterium]
MKKLPLVVVLVAACLLLFAAPASAWYVQPQTSTAYITSFVGPGQWVEWTDLNDPFGWEVRDCPIPHGYDVVVTREWSDTRPGATLIPAEYFTTMAIHGQRSDGSYFSFTITKAACGLRYWSPAYRFGDPFESWVWWRDWWVHLGPLGKGTYSGTVTQFAPHAFPTWMDQDTGEIQPLFQPIMLQPADCNWVQDISFTVGD